MTEPITKTAIETARQLLDGVIVKTPVMDLTHDRLKPALPTGSNVAMKMELFQQSGSFKARGAYIGVDQLSEEDRKAGVVTVSGGNHALAVSWAANAAGVSAKVCMPKTVDPVRVQGCRSLGADVILCETIADAFTAMEDAADQEARTILHPFEAEHMVLGSQTLGVEFFEARPDTEIFIVPVGGGGLISGMAAAIKLHNPDAKVIGVEPFGADTMSQSFEKGEPVSIDQVNTIADSLGAPMALPFSFALTQRFVDRIVKISDDEMKNGMRLLFDALKIAAEPACAASLAALIGPLREECEGRKVGIIACGSNISLARFNDLIGA